MNEYLQALLCNTVEDVLTSVYDRHDTFAEPLNGILNERFSVEKFLQDQTREDELTDKTYSKTPEGKIIFPLAGNNNFAIPYVGEIGDQASKYHQESITSHLYGDMSRMYQLKGYDTKLMLATLLHDAMKKYTAGTNKRGEVCFYGHEKVSAYYAAKVFQQLGYSRQEAEPYVHMVHGHMLPKVDWKDQRFGEERKAKFLERYGQERADLIKTISACDAGIEAGEHSFKYREGPEVVSIDEKNAIATGKKLCSRLQQDITRMQQQHKETRPSFDEMLKKAIEKSGSSQDGIKKNTTIVNHDIR